VKDPYRRIARLYDTIVEPSNAVMRKVVLGMVPPRQGMRVLEVGCGTGTNLELYQQAGCEIHGIDLSPSMLEMARAKLGEGADLRLGDAADMPYEDRAFDLVTGFLTLHEMPSTVRESTVSEMIRVVEPQGRLLLIDYDSGPVRFPKGWLFRAMIVVLEIGAGREHFRNYRDFNARDGLPGLIERHALTVIAKKMLSAGNILACEVGR
jgi:ubiquinone/menaquinone biosynthesis C-methylase UbiE